MTSTDLVTMPESKADRQKVGLLSLPPELLYQVSSFMGQKERRRLGLTCWGLHKCLQKELYDKDGEDDHHALWSACVKNTIPTANIILEFNPAVVNRLFQGRHKTRTRSGRYQNRHQEYDLGASPLSVAANRGNVSMVQKLLELNANASLPNPIGNGPSTLPNGTILCTMAGWFPVHAVMEVQAFDKQKRILELLVSHGADINRVTLDPVEVKGIQEADPPILAALEPRFPDMAPFKVEGGSHIQYKKALATSFDQQGLFVQELLRLGANPNLRDRRGRTPLMRCMDILLSYTPKFTYDIRFATVQEKDDQHDMVHELVFNYVKALVHHRADLNAVVQEEVTTGTPPVTRRGRKSILHLACNLPNGHDTMAKRLVKLGSHMNTMDSDRMTPIYEYCETPPDSIKTLRWLLKKGANVNHRDRFGRTPLHHALINRPKFTIAADKVVELLVQYGADITIKDNDGMTAEDHAAKDRDPEAKDFLKKERQRLQREQRREGAEKSRSAGRKKTQDVRHNYHAQTSGEDDRQQKKDWPRRQGQQPQKNSGAQAAQQPQLVPSTAEIYYKLHGQSGSTSTPKKANMPNKTYTPNQSNGPNQSNTPGNGCAQSNGHSDRQQQRDSPGRQGQQSQQKHAAQATQYGQREISPAEGSQKPRGQLGSNRPNNTYTPNQSNRPNQLGTPNKSNSPNNQHTQTSGHNDRQQKRDWPRRQGQQPQKNNGAQAAQQPQLVPSTAEIYYKSHGKPGPSTAQKTYTPNQSNRPNKTGAQAAQQPQLEPSTAETYYKSHGKSGPSTTQNTYMPNNGHGRKKGRGRGRFTWTPNKEDEKTDTTGAEKKEPVPLIDI